ncbi:MAG: pyridoxal-phosphate dependent enzyme [Bdellovibrionales bacterium]|nr:pyridoxal-phosphate dependent enzyme [Bdellovibrionales bacterium]
MKQTIIILSLFLTNTLFAREIYLFNLYPTLKKVPFVEIIDKNTSLYPINNLTAAISSKENPYKNLLWIKRDDLSDHPLGGNKARKLEFLMAPANLYKKTSIITSGMIGSNHAFATSVAAKDMRINTTLLLGPQPVTENVKKKLLSFHALGSKIIHYKTKIGLGLGMIKYKIKSLFNSDMFIVPPGGTTSASTLGYANAYLEMIHQFSGQELPKSIVVPMGTAGTSAGLLLGTCLAGHWEKVQIVAIGIAHSAILSNGRTVRNKAKQSFKYIKQHLNSDEVKKLKNCNFATSTKALKYIKEYSGPGYGQSSSEVYKDMRLLKRTENINLDPTYSGKAFHYFLDYAKSFIKMNKKLPKTVFWLTYNSYPLENIINSYKWKHPSEKWRELPKKLWYIFQ